jgi:small subunit ribosomal protein S24e
MEIEIDSKKNNALLNRTEVYFTVKHDGEKTPNREIIRSEIADKLNVKKEHVIVDYINTKFGVQILSGYAKVYPSLETTKQLEPNYILKRNKLAGDKSKDKKGEKKSGEEVAEKPVEIKKEQVKGEPKKEEVKKEAPVEKKEMQKPAPEKQSKEKSDESKAQKDSAPKEESKKEPAKSEEKKE